MRPNILFLLSDQHSAHTMSCAGHPVVRTPHMDRLAAAGGRFNNAYCSTPLCMPERVALLTGRFSHNNGIRHNRGYLLDELVSSLALVATLLDVAGAAMPILHGESLSPLLEGRTQSHNEAVFCELGPEKMVRQGPWKYVYHPEREIQQLFNLVDDPHELENLSATHEPLQRRLRQRLFDWLIATEAKPNSL